MQTSRIRTSRISERRGAHSFCFDAGCLDHPGPLIDLVRDMLFEVGGRARHHHATEGSKLPLYLSIGERSVDFLIELVDDLRGRIPGCSDAVPLTRLKARQEFA